MAARWVGRGAAKRRGGEGKEEIGEKGRRRKGMRLDSMSGSDGASVAAQGFSGNSLGEGGEGRAMEKEGEGKGRERGGGGEERGGGKR